MIAITGGKVFTVTQGVLEQGTVLVENGKITAVGEHVAVPEGAQVYDAAGKWVTPGLIDAHTHIAMNNEPLSYPCPSTDACEMSDPIMAHVRAVDSIDPFDMSVGKAREAGFTTCFTGPGSVTNIMGPHPANVIGGTGVSIKLKTANRMEQMAVPGSQQMKMALGEDAKRYWSMKNKGPMTRMAVGALLRETLYRARNYADALEKARQGGKAPKPDFKLDALVTVVRGEMKVRIHCHRADDIFTAIRIAEEYQLDYVIDHCTEGYKLADVLREKQIPCVVGPLLIPPHRTEVWGCRQDNPAILERAGVDFSLSGDGSSSTQWLPFQIGYCMGFGLSFEAALQGVTIRPARVLGLEHRVGSLEPGKDADIAVFTGDPFSNLTLCAATMIDGVWEYQREAN